MHYYESSTHNFLYVGRSNNFGLRKCAPAAFAGDSVTVNVVK